FQLEYYNKSSNLKSENKFPNNKFRVLVKKQGQYLHENGWAIPRYDYFEANPHTGESKKIITNSTIEVLNYLSCANQFIGINTDSEAPTISQDKSINIMNMEGGDIT